MPRTPPPLPSGKPDGDDPDVAQSPDSPDSPEAPESLAPSKSARKRRMHALQDLGERLVELPPELVRRIELPEDLAEAIAEARRTKSHEGRRRQLQYVGRLMRGVDPVPIESAIEQALGTSREAVARMHRCEQLRDELLADDEALTGLLRRHPEADAQWLRSTIRAARREHAQQPGATPRHARELYRWLRDHLPPENPQ